MKKKYYTTTEAAKILGVCLQRLNAKLKKNHFPHAVPPRGWQIPEEDIEANKRGEIPDNRRKR